MDGRANNGNKGHSTKSNKPNDGRKNQYKDALKTLSKEDLEKVIQMLFQKVIEKKDTKAAQILLEYYLTKPKIETDVTSGGEKVAVPIITWSK